MGIRVEQYSLVELEFYSNIEYKNPFCEIKVDAYLNSSYKEEVVIPAFYVGKNRWVVRFIVNDLGTYNILVKCSNVRDSLNEQKHEVIVETSILKESKSLTLSSNKEYLSTKEGGAFFWLSDTWWMALSDRLDFEEFKKLADFRAKQGFNVIQLVAGLMPDMDSFDVRGKNSAGFPFKDKYSSINIDYFHEAEAKIRYLVDSGFTVMIVGSWGYYLNRIGLDKMKKFWRYLIARWGSLDVVWCVAGETTMPYYISDSRLKEKKNLKDGFNELTKYIRDIEPFGKLITTHPIEASFKEVDSSLLDINLLQSSHNSFDSVNKAISLIEESKKLNIPTIMDEINYEGILRGNGDCMQRVSFWVSVLEGSKGFGYGANGIWQVNRVSMPFGRSPSGASWGDTPYSCAINLKGAKDIARGKEFLSRFQWWQFKPKSIDISPEPKPKYNLVMAGIENSLRLIYIYEQLPIWHNIKYKIENLEPNAVYSLYFWNPSFDAEVVLDDLITDYSGSLMLPETPSLDEWVLVIILKDKSRVDIPSLKEEYSNFLGNIIKKLLGF